MGLIGNAEFIRRASKVHGDKYNYSGIDFKGLDNWLNLTCSEHGNFMIIAKSHLKGVGCIKCKKIESARRVHDDKYDYSLVKLDGGIDTIICPKHGEFAMYFDKHIKGAKCIKCNNGMPKSEVTADVKISVAKPELTKPVGTALKSDIFDKVEKLASDWGVSKSHVIRLIVYDYFEK